MKVILLKSYKKLGQAGDLKEVSDGYARNFLIPQKIAKVADDKVVQDFKLQKKQQEKKILKLESVKQDFIKKLSQQSITILKPANEFGVLFAQVKKEDVLSELKKLNFFSTDIEVIECHFKNIGEHKVKIKFSDKTLYEFKINITADNKL